MSTKKRPKRTGPYNPVDRPERPQEDIEIDLEEEGKRFDELVEKTRKERKENQGQPTESGDDTA
jgi:hypothetical protein